MLAKKRLGDELRTARKARHLTGVEAAELVGWTDSKISRIETAASSITLYDLEQLLDLYELTGGDRVNILKLHRASKAKRWWTHAPYASTLTGNYQAMIGYEAECAAELVYEPLLVPGLLQTGDYARAVISSGPLVQDYDAIDTLVAARVRRQEVLERPDFELTAIITLASLTYQHGGAAVLRDQLGHLLDASTRPNISIRVIPETVSAGGYGGAMTVLHFADALDPSVAYLDTAVTTEEHTNPQMTRRIVRLIDHLESVASSPADSRSQIKQRMELLPDA
jgi:transcriptional regulator with XRE-family HTH domain